MNVLVVNWQDLQNPQSGGAEVHLHETFRRIAELGHKVTALVSGWPGCDPVIEADGIEIHRVGGRHTFGVAAPWYFKRVLSRFHFDIVVEDVNKVPLFSPLWVDAPTVLLVHHLFGTTAFSEAGILTAAATVVLEAPLARVFRRRPVVAVSESTKLDLVRRGLDASLIEVIPNGVDLQVYTPRVEDPEFETPTLLYLGRLKRYKGIHFILRALAVLKKSDVACRLLIVGKGDYRSQLERMAMDLGVSDRVEFRGYVSEGEKLKILRSSWVHCLTSPKEGWGIANIEAAACGTPTVASDSPGLRESVVDGTTGFLVPHGDVSRLSERLQQLLGDAPLRARFGDQAVKFASRFSWEAAARRWESILLGEISAAAGVSPSLRPGTRLDFDG